MRRYDEGQYVFLFGKNFDEDFDHEFVVHVGENASLEIFYCFFGGKDNDIKIENHLKTSARCEQRLVFFGNHNQKYHFDEKHIFHSPNAHGRFYDTGFLFDSAKSSYVSNILIEKGAQKTDSRLEMESFVFGKNSHSTMVPSLEIHANDVKAGHAGKIAHIPEESLFYLKSRGLSEVQAFSLFIEGVLSHFTSRINDARIQEIILKEYPSSRMM
ncbi:MAG: SufD family Fe-S cluster assembly protein [Parcubacteria group bacterium]|nr:SufD family Fe-S cluster assembly protein [Parcubacteria group bacterium]